MIVGDVGVDLDVMLERSEAPLAARLQELGLPEESLVVATVSRAAGTVGLANVMDHVEAGRLIVDQDQHDLGPTCGGGR